jgi:tetratricopeptide (TPR) repeat protein
LAIFRRDEITLVRLALAYEGLGDYRTARALFEEAIQIDPNHGILYAYLGRHQILVGRVEEGQENVWKGQRLMPVEIYKRFIDPYGESEALEAPPK